MKETLVRVFSCEFCEISKSTFFTEHHWLIASKHPNIKYQLLFLDLLIANNGENQLTSVYRKKHPIGFYTNYLSIMPFSYKIDHFKIGICNQQKDKTKELLENNLYQSHFIDQQITQYLCTQGNDKKRKEASNSISYDKLPDIGKLRFL